MLILYDETGVNPLPAGVQVSVYPVNQPQTSANLVGAAWTQPGGTCAIDVVPAVTYVAVFFGGQAPLTQQQFSGGSGDTTTVVVNAYRSPSLSIDGYTDEGSALLPAGWFSSAALSSGGNAYAVMRGLSGVQEAVDSQAQYELSKSRLQSSAGLDIDSWFADFLGPYLPRFQGEADQTYIARGEAFLQAPPCIQRGLQSVVEGFYKAIAAELAAAYADNLNFDSAGGYGTQGGYDQGQGFSPSQLIPTVLVWDRQDHPQLADQFNINPINDDGSFVIQIGFRPPNVGAWYLDHSHVDFETFLVDEVTYGISDTAPDPRLAQMVNLLKANGTHPIYITSLANV